MSNTAIHLHDLKKRYPNSEANAVDGLSLQVAAGEIFGLLGPNGAGKSSTVMMLCGLLQPDSGTIEVFGKNPANDGAHIRQLIGVATQEIALFPTLTAEENLLYLGRMYGLDAAMLKARITELLLRFNLQAKTKARVETLSGGMKRRLNLIAAMLHAPKLLILDEPTAGVDVQSRNLILEVLRDEHERGTTLLYSSHLMEEAERLCTRIGILDAGKLLQAGTREELLQQHPDCRHLEDVFLKLTGRSIRT